MKNILRKSIQLFILIFFIFSVFIFIFTNELIIVNAEETKDLFEGRIDESNNITNFYNETNTYQYIEFDKDNYGKDEDSEYDFYDLSEETSATVYNGAPQITVLTHGLSGHAYNWSNNGTNTFAYDSESLFLRLDDFIFKNTNQHANIYLAKMFNSNSFYLYDLNDPLNISSDNKYVETKTITEITDITKHIIIIFEASKADEYNYFVYKEFNYMLSKIVYDVKCLNGGALPKINLIGHSRGGLTNLQYALDHPQMIGSVFSIGTPYFGSDTASTEIGRDFAGDSHGLHDIIDRNIYTHYYERWNDNYNLYRNINYHALAGYSDVNFVFDALIESSDTNEIKDAVLYAVKELIYLFKKEIAYFSAAADLTDFILSYLRDNDYDETEVESYIQIISDISLFAIDNDVELFEGWLSEYFNDIPLFGDIYFMNDLLVDYFSQIGVDEHSKEVKSYGFKLYKKCFNDWDYIIEGEEKKLAKPSEAAVVHNLETRDRDFINYILSNITVGVNNKYVYEVKSNGKARITGYNGVILNENIVIPNSVDGFLVDSIGSNIFLNNGSIIKTIVLPDSVSIIEREAFSNLINLEQIQYDNLNLNMIGKNAFAGCYNLTTFGDNLNELNLPSSVYSINKMAFFGTKFGKVYINNNINYIGEGAFSNISTLNEINVDSLNNTYFSYNGVLYSNDGSLMQYPNGKTNTSFQAGAAVNGNNITNISAFAFYNEDNLRNINLNNILHISEYAFAECSNIFNITIPNTVENIDDFAFYNCEFLLNVTINKEYNGITELGVKTFDNCNENLKIYVPTHRTAEYINAPGWKSYKEKIVYDVNEFNEVEINCHIVSNDAYELSSGYKKLYKLKIDCSNNYSFIFDNPDEIKINLYNSDLEFITSYSNEIIDFFNDNIYYIDIEFEDVTSQGVINVIYQLTNPIEYYNISLGNTNILEHLHLDENNNYINRFRLNNFETEEFYRFIISGYDENNNLVTLPEGAIKVFNSQLKEEPVSRYTMINSNIKAENATNSNEIIVYLAANFYYIDILLPNNLYSSLKLEVVKVTNYNIDLFDYSSNDNQSILTVNRISYGDCLNHLNIKQAATIVLNFQGLTKGSFVILKPKITSENEKVFRDKIILDISTLSNYTFNLEEGEYYIGFINSDINAPVSLTLTRKVNGNIEDGLYHYQGSEVTLNGGNNITNTITQGFTRLIFLKNNESRLDYYWYTSNESAAVITNYGTLIALAVDNNTSIQIMAVKKSDPSVFFVKDYVITKETNLNSEVHLTLNSPIIIEREVNNHCQIDISSLNVPINWLQYYSWSTSDDDLYVDLFGRIYAYEDACGKTFTITGVYTLNPRYIITITVRVL